MKFIKIYIGFYLTMNSIINELELEAQRRTKEDGDLNPEKLTWFRGKVVGEFINSLELEAQRRTNEDGEPENLTWFRGKVIGEFINSQTQADIYVFLCSYFLEATIEFAENAGDDDDINLAYRDLLHNLILESMN
jgi:hypothetical protein